MASISIIQSGCAERRDLDERGRGPFLAEIFLTYRRQIDPVMHVGDVGRDLDHVGHRPALRLDERFDGVVSATGLTFEITATGRAAVRV